MVKCSKCGSTNLKRYVDKEVEFNYCLDCGESGKITKRVTRKGKSEIGFLIMLIGAIIYFAFMITYFVYEPDLRTVQDAMNYATLMEVLTFIGVMLFMLGSIIQIMILLKHS